MSIPKVRSFITLPYMPHPPPQTTEQRGGELGTEGKIGNMRKHGRGPGETRNTWNFTELWNVAPVLDFPSGAITLNNRVSHCAIPIFIFIIET